VPVINVSLVGPPNVTLEQVVRLAITRGHIIVAAVGNDGPAAPPLYPASYDGVVAVTAVDAHNHVLPEASRAKHVDFAARGADVLAACSPDTYATVRGTSYAAPVVAGLLAAGMTEPSVDNAHRVLADLARNAVELGRRRPDPVYGNGLVSNPHENASLPLSLLSTH
jgi:subtilisin family serine protease